LRQGKLLVVGESQTSLKKELSKLLLAVLLLGVAAFFYIKFSSAQGDVGDRAYFFDLNEKELFVAPRGSIPPISGIKRAKDAGVRAVVISTSGDPRDKKHHKIAYLEKYSPELKQMFEAVQRARTAGQSSEGIVQRSEVPAGTLVRRPNETEWHTLTSSEGKRIVTEWNVPGPDGLVPVVCSP
jgi:hypothetical protein